MEKNSTKQLPSWLVNTLPSYESATYLPQKFVDSTHELWLLKKHKNNLFLKICNNTSSPFWQVMEHLFGLNLQTDIANFHQLYSYIDENTELSVPAIIKTEAETKTKVIDKDAKEYNAFILTPEIRGTAVESANSKMVSQLALHLAKLHHQEHQKWGTLKTPAFNHKQWQVRISDTLEYFSIQQNIPKKHLIEALDVCKYALSTQFVPLMPDLRWDQFLQLDDELYALIDLDAFVLAPRELDFVLLEYILTPDQISQFIQSYTKDHPIPDINNIRPAYRLLLFLMQVLGERNIDDWMSSECYF